MRLTAFLTALTFALPIPVAAQELLETYTAHLSHADHFNSKGNRLTEVWQIIRQDRANFHRFGKRDAQDEWDSFFSSVNNRAIAERMLMNGYIDPATARYIVNNEAVVRVEIFGQGTKGTALRVTAY